MLDVFLFRARGVIVTSMFIHVDDGFLTRSGAEKERVEPGAR